MTRFGCLHVCVSPNSDTYTMFSILYLGACIAIHLYKTAHAGLACQSIEFRQLWQQQRIECHHESLWVYAFLYTLLKLHPQYNLLNVLQIEHLTEIQILGKIIIVAGLCQTKALTKDYDKVSFPQDLLALQELF